MDVNRKVLKAISYICGTLLIIGTALFFYGYFGSGSAEVTGIGIGTVMGASFIFIMGIFLVATEESIQEKNGKRQLL
ncbi:hypothetical protein [Oceanobacillus massiliensis]|uniref:hypothetical protein n=1 Tax=Oceanobacillus massiliensis TaxID=1465765 RepID=UPI0002896D12|nr:hypothetical protein [Oceanobacillus massiliensis]